jgi:aminoglycoside phosphotransferase (APT) family kinase protein
VTSATADMPAATALAWVPGVRDGEPPLRIERLLGGSVNDTWRVDTNQGRYVLRVDGPAWRRPGVERAREQELHVAAAAAGLAPRLLLRADSVGVQVCEFLDGRNWSAADFLQPAQIGRLGERLARLHALPAPAGIIPFDPGASAREYLQIMAAAGTEARDAPAALSEIDTAVQQVAEGTAGLSIIHGDLAHANLLDGAALWFLDWEYAQLADPLYDAACALAYYPQAQPLAARLLAASGLTGPGLAGRLAAAIRVYQTLSRLWHQARGVAFATDRQI